MLIIISYSLHFFKKISYVFSSFTASATAALTCRRRVTAARRRLVPVDDDDEDSESSDPALSSSFAPETKNLRAKKKKN